MQQPGKRLRAITDDAPPPPEDTPARTLPGDLVLEIVSRTDAVTIVRSAACCKPLRRDILSPDFIRRALRGMPAACLLGFLRAYDKVLPAPRPAALFALVHPATPAAASLSEARVVPLLSRGAAADLLGRYVPVTAGRGGLLLLSRRHVYRRGRTDMCVFDPFTGDRAFFPRPPDLKDDPDNRYVLLTAADGVVGSSFLLLAMKLVVLGTATSIEIQSQTASSTAADGKWGAVTTATHPLPQQYSSRYLYPCDRAVVLGTLIHWLVYSSQKSCLILTYRVAGTVAGLIELPAGGLPNRAGPLNLHLTSSPDGRLRLLVSDKFTVSIWLLLSTNGAGWERQAVIDVSPQVPKMMQRWLKRDRAIEFGGAEGRTGAVLLRPFTLSYRDVSHRNDEGVLLLDMETKEVRWINGMNNIRSTFLYEVDLASRLSAMKSF